MGRVVIVGNSNARMLDQFLRAVRRRIWYVRALDGAGIAAWYAVALLLLLGAIHRFFFSLTMTTVISIIVIPILLLLARVLLRRPALRECAVRADQEFRGLSLITTAAECADNTDPHDTFASRTVLLQGENAARSWLPEVSTRFRGASSRATILAVIPLFVALVLLYLPGADNQYADVAATAGTTKSKVVDAADDPIQPEDDVATLRNILANEARTEVSTDSVQQRIDSLVAVTPKQVDITAAMPDKSELPEDATVQAGVAGATQTNGDLPGKAIARPEPRNDSMGPAPDFSSREIITLQRTGRDFSGVANSAANYSALNLWENNMPRKIQPAASPESLSQWTILSRSQAEHARRYLTESGNAND